MISVNKQMAKGAVWMVLFKTFERSIGMISLMILARLLTPADFGTVAIATAITALLDLLSAFGFDIALIQNSDPPREHFDTVWSFEVLFGLFGATVLVVGSGAIADFYNQPKLQPVMWVLAATYVVNGFTNIGTIYFRKNLDFRREFIFLATKKICTFLVTVPTAFFLRNYWALLAGIFFGQCFSLVQSYVLHPFRPRFSLSAWRELFGVSNWLFINNMSLFMRQRSGDFIIGKLVGAATLGLFNVAEEVANLTTNELIAPINRAVFPGYVKLKKDLGALRQSFLDVNALVTSFAVPSGMGIAVLAPQIVPLMLGNQWLSIIPVIQLLALSAILMALQTNTGYIILALGYNKVHTLINLTSSIILAVTLFFAIQFWGLKGAALATLFHNVYRGPLQYHYVMKFTGVKRRQVLAIQWRPFVAAGVMVAGVWGFVQLVGLQSGTVEAIALLLSCVAVGVITYALALLALWQLVGRPRGAEQTMVTFLLEQLNRFGLGPKRSSEQPGE